MTNFTDQLQVGNAYFQQYALWNTGGSGTVPSGMPTATVSADTQALGVPFTQVFAYQIGTASTTLPSGIFFVPSTASGTASTLGTATGALVVGGVGVLDVPRALQITSTVNMATMVITIRGTDGYGQAMAWSGNGPSGDVFGNTGSFVLTPVAFKTVLTASMTAGTSTAGMAIGSANAFGLPYRIANAGKILAITVNGNPVATAGQSTITAGLATTVTPTASTVDVRGLIQLPTTQPPNDARFFTVLMVAPPVGRTVTQDDKVTSYGLTPFTS